MKTPAPDLLSRLEVILGLPRDFLDDIVAEDHADYMTVIKCCAMVETVLNEALQDVTPDPWKSWIVDRTLAEKRRLALLAGLVPKDVDKAFAAVVRIRNEVVHDVAGFSFRFSSYLSDATKRNEWAMNAGTIYTLIQNSEVKDPGAKAVESPAITVIIIASAFAIHLATSPQTRRGKAIAGIAKQVEPKPPASG
jgi:hypothetical protein